MPDAAPQTNRPAAPVQLAPPRPPLRDSFLHAHRWEISAAIVVLLLASVAIVAAILWFERRMSSPLRVSAGVRARRELEALRARGANAGLPVETARIIRRFAINEFGLTPDEMTTAELGKALRESPRVTPEAAGLIADFLRRCDVMKFAPGTAAETDLLTTAAQLVERVEQKITHGTTAR